MMFMRMKYLNNVTPLVFYPGGGNGLTGNNHPFAYFHDFALCVAEPVNVTVAQ